MREIKIRPLWALLVAVLILLVTHQTDAVRKRTRKRVVCYYTNWSVYRLGLAKYLPTNINPHLCTHLIYAFGGFDDDFQLQPFDKYQDIEKGGYARFNGLKQYNKGLRTLLALGGWSEGSGRFSELVADPDLRQTFILSVIRYLRQYNFDGLDLDWEYPGSRAGSDFADKENYATLVEELRAAFEEESIKTNRPVLLLTVAVPAGISTIEKGFNIPRLNAAVDFFNILAYDYHAATEPLTDHHAPLYALPGTSSLDYQNQLNVDYTVRFYLKSGAERRKLVVGMPTYGRSYTLLDENYNGFQAAATSPGLKGKYTKEEGYLSFYEICENVAVDEWNVYRPYPDEMGPYATLQRQWVGYDDEFIVRRKAHYVRDNRLGGIMFWSIDNDDFRGRCSGKPYPLIEAAKEAYLEPIPGSPPKQAKGPTPPPPATPDPGADFQCKREGFYPHPEQCDKYFWCLAGGPLGIVPHSFTCPTGLLFNRATDSCDFPRNVKCKIKAKETVSITFPPTKEPIVGLPNAVGAGEPTPDPLDAFYEDYDTEDLPSLDLDFVDTPAPSARPTSNGRPAAPEVLGGSRGGASSVNVDNLSGQGPPEEEQSDPEELKQLLSLIQRIGGVEGVQKLLEGGSSDVAAPQISDKERKTLSKIVGKTDTSQRTRPQYTTLSRRRPAGTADPGAATSTRGSAPVRIRGSTNASRRRVTSSRDDQTGTNTRRRPADAGEQGDGFNSRRRRPQASVETEEREATQQSGGSRFNSRRRPQYTTIDRNRRPQSPATSEDAPVEDTGSPSAGGQRQYQTLNRQRAPSRAAQEQAVETDPDTGREYATLPPRRGRPPTTPAPLESAPEPVQPTESQASRGPQRGVAIRRPGNRAPNLHRPGTTLPPRLTSKTEPTIEAQQLPGAEEEVAATTLPALRRPTSGTRRRGPSIRNRLRNRLRRPQTSTTPSSTTTTATTTTTTTPKLEIFPTEVAISEDGFDGQLPRPAHAGVRGFDPNAALDADSKEDVEYDYYYDYVFEYPDGSVKEIPAEELERLRTEIELAKQLLQAQEGKTVATGGTAFQTVNGGTTVPNSLPRAQRPDVQSLRTRGRGSFQAASQRDSKRISQQQALENASADQPQSAISGVNQPRTTRRPKISVSSTPSSVRSSSADADFEDVPEGYEVVEYEYDIDGDINEEVVIIEDEHGRRVLSTTYSPIDDPATEPPQIEESTLRQFIDREQSTTSRPQINRAQQSRGSGRIVPPIRVLNALNGRQEGSTVRPAQPVTVAPRRESTRRTPATVRSFRPTRVETTNEQALEDISAIDPAEAARLKYEQELREETKRREEELQRRREEQIRREEEEERRREEQVRRDEELLRRKEQEERVAEEARRRQKAKLSAQEQINQQQQVTTIRPDFSGSTIRIKPQRIETLHPVFDELLQTPTTFRPSIQVEPGRKQNLTPAEEAQLRYDEEIRAEQKRREEELERRKEEQIRREEEQIRRDEELKRREQQKLLVEEEFKRREQQKVLVEEELERRRQQAILVREEQERREQQQKLVDQELKRRQEQNISEEQKLTQTTEEEATTLRPAISPTTIQTLLDSQRQRQSSSTGRRRRPGLRQRSRRPNTGGDQVENVRASRPTNDINDNDNVIQVESTTEGTVTTTTVSSIDNENALSVVRGPQRFSGRSRLNRFRGRGSSRTRSRQRTSSRTTQASVNVEAATEASVTAPASVTATGQDTSVISRNRLSSRRRRPSSRRRQPTPSTTEAATTEKPVADDQNQEVDSVETVTQSSRRFRPSFGRSRVSSTRGQSRGQASRRRQPSVTTETAAVIAEAEETQDIEEAGQQVVASQITRSRSQTARRGGRRLTGLGRSRLSSRRTSLRRRPAPSTSTTTEQATTTEIATEPTVVDTIETTTSLDNDILPTQEPLSEPVTEASPIQVAIPSREELINPTSLPTDEQHRDLENRFEQFIKDNDHDDMTIEQLRELFNKQIEKQAVFVRRKPGSAAPEIIGRGTVISKPGGDRKLILQNRPGIASTSEITLVESSTLSSLLSSTLAPRSGISPRPDNGITPRPDPSSRQRRPTFRPRLPTSVSREESDIPDSRTAAQQVIEDVTSRTVVAPVFNDDDSFRGTSVRSLLNAQSGFRSLESFDDGNLVPVPTQEPFVITNNKRFSNRQRFSERSDEFSSSSEGFTDRSDTVFDEPTSITETSINEETTTPFVIRRQIIRRIQGRRRPQARSVFSQDVFASDEEGGARLPRLLTPRNRRLQINKRILQVLPTPAEFERTIVTVGSPSASTERSSKVIGAVKAVKGEELSTTSKYSEQSLSEEDIRESSTLSSSQNASELSEDAGNTAEKSKAETTTESFQRRRPSSGNRPYRVRIRPSARRRFSTRRQQVQNTPSQTKEEGIIQSEESVRSNVVVQESVSTTTQAPTATEGTITTQASTTTEAIQTTTDILKQVDTVTENEESTTASPPVSTGDYEYSDDYYYEYYDLESDNTAKIDPSAARRNQIPISSSNSDAISEDIMKITTEASAASTKTSTASPVQKSRDSGSSSIGAAQLDHDFYDYYEYDDDYYYPEEYVRNLNPRVLPTEKTSTEESLDDS